MDVLTNVFSFLFLRSWSFSGASTVYSISDEHMFHVSQPLLDATLPRHDNCEDRDEDNGRHVYDSENPMKQAKSTQKISIGNRNDIAGSGDDAGHPAMLQVQEERRRAQKAAVSSHERPKLQAAVDVDISTLVGDAVPTAVCSAGFVYVIVDGLLCRELKIEVREGDSVYSIKEKIKEEKKNAYSLFDAHELILSESENLIDVGSFMAGNALLATEEWNHNVSWGTKAQPLIVEDPTIRKQKGEFCFYYAFFNSKIYISICYTTLNDNILRFSSWLREGDGLTQELLETVPAIVHKAHFNDLRLIVGTNEWSKFVCGRI